MDKTRRGWLKGLMAIPALVVGAKFLPAAPEAVKVEEKEELPMVRQGVQTLSHTQDLRTYTLTTSYVTSMVYGWEEKHRVSR